MRWDGVHLIYDVGILDKVGVTEISRSPDGISLLDLSKVDGAGDSVATVIMEHMGVTYDFLPVEIMTRVSADIMCSVMIIKKQISPARMQTTRHQKQHALPPPFSGYPSMFVVTGSNIYFYACCAKVGEFNTVIMRFYSDSLQRAI